MVLYPWFLRVKFPWFTVPLVIHFCNAMKGWMEQIWELCFVFFRPSCKIQDQVILGQFKAERCWQGSPILKEEINWLIFQHFNIFCSQWHRSQPVINGWLFCLCLIHKDLFLSKWWQEVLFQKPKKLACSLYKPVTWFMCLLRTGNPVSSSTFYATKIII